MLVRFQKIMTAVAAAAWLSAAGCGEPGCPDGFTKVGKSCKRLDAGVAGDAEVLGPRLEAGQDPVTMRDAGAVDGAVTFDSATGLDAAPFADATSGSDGAGAEASFGSDAASSLDSAVSGDAASLPADASAPIDAASDAPVGCGAGYVLKAGACQDIDECFEGTHACHMTSTCKNTAGSYDCTCPLGYSGGTNAGFACAPRIAVGSAHVCVLLTNGTVQCWGENSYGQLGDGTQTPRTVPTVVTGLSDVAVVRAFSTGNCAILRDRTVRCWGDNTYGQLGDGSTMNRLSPVKVEKVEGAVAIASFAHSCAVIQNGTLKCWGANTAGQLGTGMASTTPTPTPVGALGITTAADVAVGNAQTCVILRNGGVQCWGSGLLGGSTAESLSPVTLGVPQSTKAIGISPFHACSLHANDAVYCWGPSTLNGSGVSEGDEGPELVSGLSAASLGVGGYATWVVQVDGQVAWWNAGTRPAVLAGPRAVAVSAMLNKVCELLESGAVACGVAENTTGAAHVVQPGFYLW